MATADDTRTIHGLVFDEGRAARAKTLAVEPLGGQRYRVSGGATPHLVDLTAPAPTPPCDCEDAKYHTDAGAPACKHTLAALIHVLQRTHEHLQQAGIIPPAATEATT